MKSVGGGAVPLVSLWLCPHSYHCLLLPDPRALASVGVVTLHLLLPDSLWLFSGISRWTNLENVVFSLIFQQLLLASDVLEGRVKVTQAQPGTVVGLGSDTCFMCSLL